MATAPTSPIKAMAAIVGIFLLLFTGLAVLFSTIAWVDFLTTDERNRIACITSWDDKFDPKYEAATCSIMQAGYRVPIAEYTKQPANIRTPEGRDY